jgi:hypothetical protein
MSKQPSPNMLEGGNSNTVTKVGGTVVRKSGAWSPFVHELLRFLSENNFAEAPRLITTDGKTETLTYIEGTVGNDPMPVYMLSEDILVESAQLLRRFHDITEQFPVLDHKEFMLPQQPNMQHEVICHNDFAPYNLVFRNQHIVGLIDFDTSAPGERIWDIAYAVYRFAPLTTYNHAQIMGWTNNPDRHKRLGLFCDAYGLDERENLINTVIQRLEALVNYIEENNTSIDDIPLYQRDIAYIQSNRKSLEKGLLSK